MNLLVQKLKEVLYSVLPIVAIVLVLHVAATPLETPQLIRFLLGALLIVAGLTVFLLGLDLGITPIGNLIGSRLTKVNKLWLIAAGGLILGFLVSIAEPDLHILANQVAFVTNGVISKFSILLIVSLGIAVLLAVGLIRIVYNIPLYLLLAGLYGIVLILSFFTSSAFLGISFDASGATTGALTVPFILALAIGVSAMKKDSKASEKDSFGLVAVTSIGAILAVMIMSILSKTDEITVSLQIDLSPSSSVLAPFAQKLPAIALEIFIALLPLVSVFLIFHFIWFKLTKKAITKILKGVLYSFLGLVLFLLGVNAGFMDVGTVVGYHVAKLSPGLLIGVGFALGLATILAEPAVHVLTHQIEEVTSGYVKRKLVLIALSIGVAFAVALSMVRILVPEIKLWHYLLPGYTIALALTLFAPKLFVGIAFDSGGVASGPMTATFILAFAQGAAEAIEGADVLLDGFGIISMVALTPLIALQILGLIYKIKTDKGRAKNHAA